MLLEHTSSRKKQSGFTLIELMVSLALIMILASISIPVYHSFQTRNDLDIAVSTTAQIIRRAQALSQAVSGDSSWGVYAQSNKITIFKGTSFLGRDSSFDETFETPSISNVSGLTELVFQKFSGEPITTGDIILKSVDDETKKISIGAKGVLSY